MEKENKYSTNANPKESLHDIIMEVKEEYFSDLNVDEIPNSDVSDVSESELNEGDREAISKMEKNQDIDSKIEISKALTDKYIEKNHLFMSTFVKTYQSDANEAKRVYYNEKLKFDVKEVRGKKDLQKLLYRYIEGMQWVMYYYYKGAQHWRWYYPYHYAPMISDLGSNIVQDFLDG